ncbi:MULTISPECIES: transposase [Trichocoleus]|uniref:Transposase n=1 Tax=Trichocoleus desertorum GB2-A4 TaxID=2933944 RepID=A0ABV0J3Z0_9CYAN|nr:transposase [Trichocoleus sp. FACHB-46]MBD1861843.1 transposase [Trichocoleus sp. FACHB-46]
MTPRKLSESDKQNILHLYRHPGETTSTLAERYGVSNTTISRVLKSLLPEHEYEALVQQKRAARPQAGFAEFAAELAFEEFETAPVEEPVQEPVQEPIEVSEAAIAQPDIPVEAVEVTTEVTTEVELAAEEFIEVSEAAIAQPKISVEAVEVAAEVAPVETVEAVATSTPKPAIAPPITRRQRKRSGAVDEISANESEPASEPPEVVEAQLQLLEVPSVAPEVEKKPTKAPPIKVAAAPIEAEPNLGFTEASLSADLQAQAAELVDLDDDDLDDDDLDDDDLDDLDDEDEDDDDDDLDDADAFMGGQLQTQAFVRVLPLADASIPKTFYLVVDRMAELITRPLREFGDLGQIPSEDVQAKTLPIFDNHRIARRFSKRNQRVIKVPDGRVLPKVSVYLQAKGITRLLIDGQVYSL